VSRPFNSIVQIHDFWVHTYGELLTTNETTKMKIEIEDCLLMEFECNKSKYHLKDVLLGKLFVLLIRIKVKHMELILIKKETTGSEPNLHIQTENVTKFEIMDGCPLKGETIPVRLFLGGLNLTPTYKSVHNKFSVKYFITLMLVDDEDRRYFKQQEIIFWRKISKGKQMKQKQPISEPDKLATLGKSIHIDGNNV